MTTLVLTTEEFAAVALAGTMAGETATVRGRTYAVRECDEAAGAALGRDTATGEDVRLVRRNGEAPAEKPSRERKLRSHLRAPAPTSEQVERGVERVLIEVDLNKIRPNPANPRSTPSDESLAELAQSIREVGLVQPLVVAPEGEGYILLAGERRWRAARLAGLEAVPCVIRQVADEGEAQALMLVENLQRADLNAIEEARGFRRLADLGWKQARIGATVGRSQPAVANALRLLELPEAVQALIEAGTLTAAHGRALARFAEFPEVCARMAELTARHGYSSKELEGQKVPWSYDLKNRGLIEEFGWQPAFDPEACARACPYGAYRVDGSRKLCLRPDHYRELEAAAHAEQRAAVLERMAEEEPEMLARLGEREEAGALGGAALAERLELPVVTWERKGADWQRLDEERLPPGCEATCPDRRPAILEGAVILACMRPTHWGELAQAEATRIQAERDQAAATAEQAVWQALWGDPEGVQWLSPRILAPLVREVCVQIPLGIVRQVIEEQGLALKAEQFQGYQDTPEAGLDALAALNGPRLLEFALGLILREERLQAMQWHRRASVTRWLLGERGESDDRDETS